MKNMLLLTSYLVCIFLACRSQSDTPAISLSDTQKIVFLDSLEAAATITTDNAEGFFGQIGKLDMEIQLKRNYPEDTPRDSVLSDYREFLRQDVTGFTPKEIQVLTETWHEAYRRVSVLNPDLFPAEIRLIKTIGRHYGPGAYYTRERNIIIPANELIEPSVDQLLPVMLHELFHIYSRYHPEKRAALYRLIGFEALGEFPSGLIMDEALRERILLNPDGINYAVGIRLQTADGEQLAVPIVKAETRAYEPEKNSFFNHLDFNLYPVENSGQGALRVVSSPDGSSPLKLQEAQDFFRQIRDNTEYIIHPDEIMADNFVLLILSGAGKIEYRTERLSEEGKALLEDVKQVFAGQVAGE